MKALIRSIFLLLILCATEIQAQTWTDEEMAAYKLAYKEAKADFLDGNYKNYTTYFESIKTFAGISKFEALKMASQSYKNLQDHQSVAQVYKEAIKSYGRMVVEDYWEHFTVGESDPNPVKDTVDEPARFPDGMAAFYEYVREELQYPKDAMAQGIEGRVFVQVIVNKDGSLDGIQAVKGIGYGCDAEAERIIRNAPPFNPGMQNGEAVPTLMMLPIIFRVNKDIK